MVRGIRIGRLRTLRLLIVLLAPLIGTGCLLTRVPDVLNPNATEAATAEVTPASGPPPTLPALPGSIGPYAYAADVNPLTGQRVSDPATLNRRPMVVKISNAPPIVRPQAGIGEANIVYEHYAEGGLTRFSAIFYDQLPERVGSIRSARLIDYELMPMYKGLLVYSGASNGVNALNARSDFADRLYMGILFGLPYYFRDEDLVAPHNLFANLSAIAQKATDEGQNDRQDLRGMAFLQQPPPDDDGSGMGADIRYIATEAQWVYDSSTGVYKRYSDHQPHADALTNQQISAENVVILYAEHRFTDIVESEFQGAKSYSIEIKLWFEGDAVLLRDGRRYDVHWWRPTREDMIRLMTKDGQLMYFKPGTTWFEVVRTPDTMDPAEESVTIQ